MDVKDRRYQVKQVLEGQNADHFSPYLDQVFWLCLGPLN